MIETSLHITLLLRTVAYFVFKITYQLPKTQNLQNLIILRKHINDGDKFRLRIG